MDINAVARDIYEILSNDKSSWVYKDGKTLKQSLGLLASWGAKKGELDSIAEAVFLETLMPEEVLLQKVTKCSSDKLKVVSKKEVEGMVSFVMEKTIAVQLRKVPFIQSVLETAYGTDFYDEVVREVSNFIKKPNIAIVDNLKKTKIGNRGSDFIERGKVNTSGGNVESSSTSGAAKWGGVILGIAMITHGAYAAATVVSENKEQNNWQDMPLNTLEKGVWTRMILHSMEVVSGAALARFLWRR